MSHRTMLRAATLALLAGAGALLLAGCGGGSSILSGSGAAGSGALRIQVQWPEAGRVIPAATTSLVITVTGQGLTRALEGVIDRAANPEQNSFVFTPVPLGTKTVAIKGYDAASKLLAQGTGSTVIENNQTATVEITLTELTVPDHEVALGLEHIAAAQAQMHLDNYAGAQSEFQAALGHFEAALGAVPNHDAANAAWIIAKGGYVACDLRIRYATWIVDTGGGAAAPRMPLAGTVRSALSAAAQTLDVLALGSALRSSEALRLPLEGMLREVTRAQRMGVSSRQTVPPFPVDQAIADLRDLVLPTLQQMLNHLEPLQRPDLALQIMDVPDPGMYIQLDYGDVLLLGGWLHGAVAALNQVLAYDLNPGTFYDIHRDLYQYDTSPADGKVTAAEYTAPAPFGQRAADGVARMATALAEYRTTADLVVQGVAATLSEPEDDHELLPVNTDAQVRADVQKAGMIAAELARALTGPYVLYAAMFDLPEDVTINLANFFTSPIADFRSVLPTFTVISPDVYSIEPPTGWPDRTFGNLFPAGLPDSILYPTGGVDIGIS